MSEQVPPTERFTLKSPFELNKSLDHALRFRPQEETPTAFRERLGVMYTAPIQKAYLNAAWEGAIPGVIGMYVMDRFMRGQDATLSEKARAYFPTDQNQHLFGLTEDQQGNEANFRLIMDREKAGGIIIACNVAAAQLSQMGQESVRQAREIVTNIILGKAKLEEGTFLDKAKLLALRAELLPMRVVLGEEMLNDLIEKTVRDQITERSLGVQFTNTADRIQRIGGSLNDEYNPIDLRVQQFGLFVGGLDLGIHPEHHKNIEEAVQTDFGTPLGS